MVRAISSWGRQRTLVAVRSNENQVEIQWGHVYATRLFTGRNEYTKELLRLHTCVHDWTLACLNRDLDNELYRRAFHCVARSVKWETEAEYWVVNRRLLQHVHRLQYNRRR